MAIFPLKEIPAQGRNDSYGVEMTAVEGTP
jgi:hypothetical protein